MSLLSKRYIQLCLFVTSDSKSERNCCGRVDLCTNSVVQKGREKSVIIKGYHKDDDNSGKKRVLVVWGDSCEVCVVLFFQKGLR